MTGPLVQDEAPEHGLFLGDELQTLRQFVQEEYLEHGLFLKDELQIRRQFVLNEALSMGLSYSSRTIPQCTGNFSRTKPLSTDYSSKMNSQ
jgi:hypothetical protein